MNLELFPSLFAGAAYQFSGFSAGWFEHEHVLVYAAWLPLILHCYNIAALNRSLRWLCGAAGLLGMLGTVGMLQFWAYSLIIAGCWSLFIWWKQQRKLQSLPWLVGSWFFALAVSAIAIWPQLLDLSGQARTLIPWPSQIMAFRQILWPMPIAVWLPDFVGNPAAGFHIQRATNGGYWIYAETYIYAGILPVLIAPYAWRFRARPECKFFAYLTLLTLLVCTTPLFAITYHLIPGFNKTIITRVLAFWPLCLCVLSAFGLQSICAHKDRPRLSIYLATAMLILLGSATAIFPFYKTKLYQYWYTGGYIREPDPSLANLEALSRYRFEQFYSLTNFSLYWPILILIASIITLSCLPKSKKALWALIIIALLDPAAYSLRYNTATSVNQLFPMVPEIAFLKKQSPATTGRIMNLGEVRPNALLTYRLSSFDGDESIYPKATLDYANAMVNSDPVNWPILFHAKTFPMDSFDQRLADIASINWLVARHQKSIDSPWRQVFSSNLKIYHNSSALPRVYWVPQVLSVGSNSQALARIMSPEWHRGIVAVEMPLAPKPQLVDKKLVEPVAIAYSRPQAEEIVIEPVEADGWLIVNEGFHPGWTARQGSSACPVYRANGMFMAIKVKAGKLTYLSFKAKGWYEGLATTFCALTGLLILAIGETITLRKRQTL